jgi:hypothetical protein
MTSRLSTAAPILAVLAIVLAMLGAYVGGYLWLGECSRTFDRETDETICISRGYQPGWLSIASHKQRYTAYRIPGERMR